MNTSIKTFTKFFILTLVCIAFGNFSAAAQTDGKPRNSFVFYKIDNQAQIFINDELAWDSGVIEGAPDLNMEVDINPFLTDGSNTVTVKLLNTRCDQCLSNHWAIQYDVYDNGEYMDFVYENGDDKAEVVEVFSQSYEWGSEY